MLLRLVKKTLIELSDKQKQDRKKHEFLRSENKNIVLI